MKKYVFSVFTAFILCFNGCISAQNTNTEMQIIETLKDFYTKYNAVWSIKPPLTPDILERKLDSLNAIYCTSALRKDAKKSIEGDYGQDLLTNDLASVDLNENLKIEKDSTNENVYVVSFTATNSDASGNPVKQNVVLHVSVVKEKEGYKINDVK
jgi:hypothetical protein